MSGIDIMNVEPWWKETEQDVGQAFIFAPEKRKTTMANTVAFISAHVITCWLKITEATLGGSKGEQLAKCFGHHLRRSSL